MNNILKLKISLIMLWFKSAHIKPGRAFAVISTFSLAALLLFLSGYGGIPRADPLIKVISNRSFLLDTPGCRIPDWDPYDPSVRGFVRLVSSGRFHCPGRPSPLSAIPGGAVGLNRTLLAFYYGRDNLTCTYRPIVRDPGPPLKPTDSRSTFGGSALPLPFDTPLGEDFILAECPMADFPNFAQFLPLVPLKPAVEGRKDPLQQQEGRSLSVIMVGIDSVSKLNFLRHFRDTRRFIEENLSHFELKGYTKVADNTFPNLVPLLTGHFVEHYYHHLKGAFFDDLDFIWKDFSKRGYRTLFAEDAPRMATFNYLKKGFRDPPADYYYRPFAVAIEKSLTRRHFARCLQSELETEVLFGYLKSFVRTMQRRLLFAFTFSASLTHNSLNAAGYADEPTLRLLRGLHEEGALNRSLLILFSDHGIRFGPIRLTYVGKFEERMPFVYLSFPPWFLEKRPDLARNLRANQNRLTTPFDIHATLAHLLNLDGGPPSTPHGLSLLGEVPEERTCEQAAVLPHWCPCHTHRSVPVSEPVVQNCGLALIDTINALLLPHKAQCAALRLGQVLDARLATAFRKVGQHVERVVNTPADYLVMIRAQPAGGIFEGTVRYDAEGGTYNVLDDIGRLNAYGNQSICIRSARMRKFCYCKSWRS